MSLLGYDTYRQSGFDWIGTIPAHWGVRKFRHSFRESDEKIDGEVVGPMLSVSGYRGIEIKEYDDENRRRTDDELQGYRIVRPGQLVVNTMWLNYAGLGVSSHEGHVSPAYRAYWIAKDLEPRFVHHMMRSGEFVKGYTKFLTGIRPNSLQMSREDLMEFALAEPPRGEQAAIAEFLDRETAKIDALIAEQEKLLTLLAEKRQATISHAVTRGLNPNATMKDSGIPWLGEVPAHWIRMAIKHALRGVIDTEHKTAPFYDDGVYAVVRTSNVKDGELVLDDAKYTDQQGFEEWTRRGVPEPGDIIFTREAPAGEACIVPEDLPLCLGQRTVLMKTDRERLDPKYGLYSLYGGLASEFIDVLSQGSTVAHFNMSDIGNIPLLLPPIEEQRRIVAFLESESTKLATLKLTCECAIDLLKERRSALISAAVTGKIDVRNAVSREATAA